ncbi:hypothetical protein INT44_002307 [Umbelopsis vinacea]|uniref:Mitochondrial cardiolipin hydrolase n=1 Tax=Umbelopsis vinacea TaxID=44442 RepID=A0A8H7UNR1_9FUNG|nr:hypothetical protein INT44_002307 [Umbelopsis vinacea]
MSVEEAKKLNFNDLLSKTMHSASYIASEPDFRKAMTTEFNSTLASKSSSPSNTLRTVEQMFDAASQVCHNSGDRDVVNWLRTTVLLAVKQGFDETGGSPSKPKSSSSSSAVKRKSNKYEEDGFIVPDDADKIEHNQLGASDDDYEPPSDEDDDEYVPTDEDAVVPGTKPSSPKSSPRGKRGSGQKGAKKSTKVAEDGLNHSKKSGDVFPSKDDSGRSEKQQQMQNYHQMSFPKGSFIQAYFFPSKESYSAFLSALNTARSTLDICVFSITDDDTADALIAAKKRGVKIRIITDDQQAAIKGADASRLSKDYGIPYKTDHTQGYMHNKFAIIDHQLMINGSFNWSKGARFKNKENIIITNIKSCIDDFDKQFDELWSAF